MVLSKKDVGEKIKEARVIKSKSSGGKYTQRDLANALGISQGYLGDIENGRTYPNYVLLNKIAEACGVPFSFFSDRSNFGLVIKQMREEKGVSQEDFAKIVDIPFDDYCKIENSEISKSITLEKWFKIAEYLNIPKEFIFELVLPEGIQVQIVNKGAPESSPEEDVEITYTEWNMIKNFRKLSSPSQKTVLTLMENLEIVDKTQKEHAVNKEVG